jgi:4a-hydroxytetrahydrobiopterin dehydratase
MINLHDPIPFATESAMRCPKERDALCLSCQVVGAAFGVCIWLKYNGHMEKLKDMACVPCEGGAKPLAKNAAARLLTELEGWTMSRDAKSLEKEIVFKNFDKAMDFVNVVADEAEREGHHPDIDIRYNKVKLVLSTHAIGGLSENDFILASKIDAIKL